MGMGKSENHGDDTPTSTQTGVPSELKSNEDDNGHLIPNLEFEETNDAMAISVRSKESNANSMSQSSQGSHPSNSPQKSDLMNQAEINVVDEQIGEQREANIDGQEEESFEREGLSKDKAPDHYEQDQQQLDPDERSPEKLNSRGSCNPVLPLEVGETSSNHHTPLLSETTSSATRKSPRLQAQAALPVNTDDDHEASRWLDGEGERFKNAADKGPVMEELSSCSRQEQCRTDEPSKQQEQERSGNSEEEFQVEVMPSSKILFEIPTAVQEEGRKCPTTESGGGSAGGGKAAAKRSVARKGKSVKQLHLDWSEEESEPVREMEEKDMMDTVTSIQEPEIEEVDKYGREKECSSERKRNTAGQMDPINKASEGGAKKQHDTEEVVKKKARSSDSTGRSEAFSCLREARSENEPKAVRKPQNVSRKKKLLGSTATMLQDTPPLLDAPSFDTTLPAFEEAHNTSKNQKSISKPSTGAVSFTKEKKKHQNESLNEDLLADSDFDREEEPLERKSNARPAVENPVKTSNKANTKSFESRVAKNIEGSEQRCGDIKKKSKGKICSTPGKQKIKTSAKQKNSSQKRGDKRKAPKRNISFLDFTNYDHLEILPRKSCDLSRSVNVTSDVVESSKKRQFFKNTISIPDHLTKRGDRRLSVP